MQYFSTFAWIVRNICRLVSIRGRRLWFYFFFTVANEISYTFMCAFCSIVKSCWFTHCIATFIRDRTCDNYTHGSIGCQTAHSIIRDAILKQQSARCSILAIDLPVYWCRIKANSETFLLATELENQGANCVALTETAHNVPPFTIDAHFIENRIKKKRRQTEDPRLSQQHSARGLPNWLN